MRDFDFLQPASVSEVTRMLADLGDECRVIAGGTALMLAMRQRMLTPTHLISLAALQSLRGIEYDETRGLRIGALALHAEVARSPSVQAYYPMLASMASRVANPQVRNQGTIGGNLCYADPATDPPGCLMALDAEVVITGTRGERVMGVEEFFVDYFTTALEPDELLSEIRIAPPEAGTAGVYSRFLRTAAEHRPLASVALLARRSGATCHHIRIAVGASTPIPLRLRRAEAFLKGRDVTVDLADEMADIVAADIEPISDQRGAADYRRDMVRVIARRSLLELFDLDVKEGVPA
ncbi:MAG: xanthine dehydrogenase family protein subunit M [Variovorax sp.]